MMHHQFRFIRLLFILKKYSYVTRSNTIRDFQCILRTRESRHNFHAKQREVWIRRIISYICRLNKKFPPYGRMVENVPRIKMIIRWKLRSLNENSAMSSPWFSEFRDDCRRFLRDDASTRASVWITITWTNCNLAWGSKKVKSKTKMQPL